MLSIQMLCVYEDKIVPIIVAGKLRIKSGKRDEFIQKSIEAISLARKLDACEDFSVSVDPIFEKWKSRETLEEFRNSGPDNDSFSLVESFNVNEHEVNT